ncbi:MAG: metal-dependent phosphohydrolase, partial [Leptolyngbyaceae cyanobacterium SM1_4_3]|nr:metal-dependent phosphohydrolase [Leptolyngbyaceae cyanobacterium SM1_4_3]
MLEGSILQKLGSAHQAGQPGRRPLNFGVYYKNTLVALCHALEDAILDANSAPVVITAFQQGKWYLEEADRYSQIAEQASQIVIMAAAGTGFAEHPTSQRSNVALVNLDATDPVAQEWHLIILSPSYTAMVLCQELSEADYGAAGVPQQDLERKFYGFWTFEPGLVLETAELAIAHIHRYDPELQQSLAAQVKAIATLTQSHEARCNQPSVDNLGEIVFRVVDYLQTSQHSLPQAASYASNTQQGLDNNLISNELQAYLRVAQLIDQSDVTIPWRRQR